MTTQTADYLDAATHLPDGARLVLHNVAWADYERLLAELGDRAQLRVSYDGGLLDIMSPSAVFWHLDENGAYTAAANSLLFPFLTSERIAEFLAGAESIRSHEARRDFRAWLSSVDPKSR